MKRISVAIWWLLNSTWKYRQITKLHAPLFSERGLLSPLGWREVPRESPFLKVFKERLDWALSAMV